MRLTLMLGFVSAACASLNAGRRGLGIFGSQRPPLALPRRTILTCGTAALLGAPKASSAAVRERGGVQWTVTLPEEFAVSRQLESIVRVRVEQVLAAEAPGGLQCKLLLVPFGQQASGSLDSDEQLSLARYFFDAQGSPTEVARTMLTSAGRSPGVLSTAQSGEASLARDGSGRRYVTYSYESERCTGEVYQGECMGTSTRRVSYAALTMSSLSQFRTNTERERMAEQGRVREVNVLWLLTASAPEGMSGDVRKSLKAIATSLYVP